MTDIESVLFDSADRGRIVVVTAGFALWHAGKCIAAARWSDVSRARAYKRLRADGSEAVCVAVELSDGSEMELVNEAPGWDAFVDRASGALPDVLQPRAWLPTVMHPNFGAKELVLFERRQPGASGSRAKKFPPR